MGNLAILAGAGALPVLITKNRPNAFVIGFHGVKIDLATTEVFQFEKMGALFSYLKKNNVSEVVFAGSMARPPLQADLFDSTMAALAPRLISAMQGGDDALLRLVIDIFTEQGFAVVGAHEILPELICVSGPVAGKQPTESAMKDAKRAGEIINALAPLDVGQGAVVAHGLCLGIETLQGTDAMLDFVRKTPKELRAGRKGVLVKTAKHGQDLRIDMPAIGPQTVRSAAMAGLEGIVIGAGKVMILDREETLQSIDKAGLFLVAVDF